jgi:hypothetical protein
VTTGTETFDWPRFYRANAAAQPRGLIVGFAREAAQLFQVYWHPDSGHPPDEQGRLASPFGPATFEACEAWLEARP